MRYLNIWNDIHPVTRWKGDEGLMDYLVEAGQSGPIGLMCAEEASIHSVTPFLTKERFEKFHKVYLSYFEDFFYHLFLNFFQTLYLLTF